MAGENAEDLTADELAFVEAAANAERYTGDPEVPTKIRSSVLAGVLTGEIGQSNPRGVFVTGVTFEGELDLVNRTTKTALEVKSCHFESELLLDDARVHSIYAYSTTFASIAGAGLKGAGGVRPQLFFEDCRILNDLILHSAAISSLELRNCTLPALLGTSLDASGPIWIIDGTRIQRMVDLRNAQLSSFMVTDSTISRGEHQIVDGAVHFAVMMGGSHVRGTVGFHRFKPEAEAKIDGPMHFYHARIDGNLEFNGFVVDGRLDDESLKVHAENNPQIPHSAIDLEITDIRGYTIISGQSEILGGIRLTSAKLNGLHIMDCTIKAQAQQNLDDPAAAIDCHYTTFSSFLNILETTNGYTGRTKATRKAIDFEGPIYLNQSHANMINLHASVIPDKTLYMDGLTYNRLSALGTEWTGNLRELLRKQGGLEDDEFRPQPWEQAAKVLDDMGADVAARNVRIEKARRQSRAARSQFLEETEIGVLKWPAYWAGRLFDLLYDITIGFGYVPLRAMWGLAIMVAIGATSAHFLHNEGLIVKSDAARDPSFFAFFYALDTFVPVLKIGIADLWRPLDGVDWLWFGLWSYKLIGWVLGGFAVAGFTGLAKR